MIFDLIEIKKKQQYSRDLMGKHSTNRRLLKYFSFIFPINEKKNGNFTEKCVNFVIMMTSYLVALATYSCQTYPKSVQGMSK